MSDSMSDSLSARIARLNALAPDKRNIRITLDDMGCEVRLERLWEVVQSLSLEHAAEIAWLADHKGTLCVGVRRCPLISRSLLDALVVAWSTHCEYEIELCDGRFSLNETNGPGWCNVSNKDNPDGESNPSYDLCIPSTNSWGRIPT